MLLGLLCALSLLCGAAEAIGKAPLILRREEALLPLFEYPSKKFGLPKALIMAIARQESYMAPWVLNLAGKDFHPRSRKEALAIAERALAAGMSFDVGIMQINSYWIRKYNLPLDKVLEPKNNVYIGCWILAQEVRRHGMNWRAVAYYHTPLHKSREHHNRGYSYVLRIQKHLKDILVSYNTESLKNKDNE